MKNARIDSPATSPGATRGHLSTAIAAAAAVLGSCLLVFVRGRPSVEADAGIFVSIAARLAGGAHLYTGVWDNKPPFFYYAQGLAFDVVGWRGTFVLDAFWLSLAVVSMGLLLRALVGSRSVAAAGAVVYPLVLTGAWYYAGYAELPAMALAPVIAWLVVRSRPVAAGGILAVALFFRADYGLIFAALIVSSLLVTGKDRRAMLGDVARLLAGLLAVLAVIVAVLAIRGELSAYVDTVRAQSGYPNRVLLQEGEPTGVVGHVSRMVRIAFDEPLRAVFFAGFAAAIAAALLAAVRRRRDQPSRTGALDPTASTAVFLLATGIAIVVTLALTGLWDHSLEVIALPAAFGACVLMAAVRPRFEGRPWHLAASLAATIVLCGVAFGGISHSLGSPGSSQPLSDWWRTPPEVSAEALDEVAARHPGSSQVSYGRFGSNQDGGFAAFVDQDLDLACPIFHQYAFSTNLDEALSCIRDEAPQLVLVGPQFKRLPGSASASWNRFVVASRSLLRTRYETALLRSSPQGTVEVWKRK